MILKKIKFLLLFCLLHVSMQAQTLLSEGTIAYKITISGKVPTPANEPAIAETKSGTVCFKIKGDNVRQDIVLEDGYQHSQISNYTTGKEIILQSINDLRYAVEINISNNNQSDNPYYGAVLKINKETKSFAGYEATAASVTYKNGTALPLYFLPGHYLNHPEIFDAFPNLKGIPVSYDLLLPNGFNMHFELSLFNEEPVQNAVFRIPEGYRIISHKEYEKLLK
jgi:hypothetical protein